jgi:actin-like ATPase involved in cell morphogenesis
MGKNVGIDVGYGYTKTYDGKTARLFPTAVSKKTPKEALNEVERVSVDGDIFVVGEDAIDSGFGLISTTTSSFAASDGWIAVLGYAIAMNLSPDELDGSTVVIGLPPGQFSKEYAAEIVETVKRSVIQYKGRMYPMNRTDIRVIPQGAGIFFLFGSSNHDAYDKNIAVVDMGHHTLDMVLFAKGKYVQQTAKTATLGISQLLDNIGKEFYNKYRIPIQQNEAERLLREGSLTICNETYHISDMRETVVSYGMQVSSLIDSYIGNLSRKPDECIVGGGGVMALKDVLKLKYKLTVVPDPEFANAHGYWYYATYAR